MTAVLVTAIPGLEQRPSAGSRLVVPVPFYGGRGVGQETLRRGQGLQCVRTGVRVRVHDFVQALVTGCHFAGVTFDPTDDFVLTSFEAEGGVQGLETTALQQLHGGADGHWVARREGRRGEQAISPASADV